MVHSAGQNSALKDKCSDAGVHWNDPTAASSRWLSEICSKWFASLFLRTWKSNLLKCGPTETCVGQSYVGIWVSVHSCMERRGRTEQGINRRLFQFAVPFVLCCRKKSNKNKASILNLINMCRCRQQLMNESLWRARLPSFPPQNGCLICWAPKCVHLKCKLC